MKTEKDLFEAAVSLIEERFGKSSDSGAAAVLTAAGRILTSTAPETLNDAVSLCHETGAICEAFKLNEKIVASICVHQDKHGRNIVLTPCGVCQERLFFYGAEVKVGTYDKKAPTKWSFKSLSEIQPFYWRKAINKP